MPKEPVNEPHKYPINGTLDLHQFLPQETKEVIMEFINVCLEKKIYSLRIVHGKGKGVQRKIVHSLLKKHPSVSNYKHEGGSGGNWGATVVNLIPN